MAWFYQYRDILSPFSRKNIFVNNIISVIAFLNNIIFGKIMNNIGIRTIDDIVTTCGSLHGIYCD